MVKQWEINQEFGLEAMPQAIYGSKAESRAWYGNRPFFTSPNMLHIPPGSGLGNGTQLAQQYLSLMWYQEQLLLNDGNGNTNANNPIDYPYVYGFIADLNHASNAPEAGLLMMWMVKSLQEEVEPGVGPQYGTAGFQPRYVTPEFLVDSNWLGAWSATSAPEKTSLLQGYINQWLPVVQSYSQAQYVQGGNANPALNPQSKSMPAPCNALRTRSRGIEPIPGGSAGAGCSAPYGSEVRPGHRLSGKSRVMCWTFCRMVGSASMAQRRFRVRLTTGRRTGGDVSRQPRNVRDRTGRAGRTAGSRCRYDAGTQRHGLMCRRRAPSCSARVHASSLRETVSNSDCLLEFQLSGIPF